MMNTPKQILMDLGVPEALIATGRGVLKVKRHRMVPEIIDYKMTDITPVPMMVTNQMNQAANDMVRMTAIPFLEQECAKYIDPKIAFSLSPTKLQNVKFHVWSLRLEGDIVNKLKNAGTDGKQGTTTVWFFESCPTSSDEYDWSTVSGSADIKSKFDHELVDDKTNKLLDEFTQKIDAKRGKTVSSTAHWSSDGLGNFVHQIMSILLTGGIVTENGYDVTVNYEFRGAKSVTKHIDARVWIPISGDIKWVWD